MRDDRSRGGSTASAAVASGVRPEEIILPRTIALPVTPNEFRATLLSHGFASLEPFVIDADACRLTVSFDLPLGRGVVQVRVDGDRCLMSAKRGSTKACHRVAATVLSLDRDLSGLHAKTTGRWAWIAEMGMGRFLRSPSLFEDCCKALFATNTQFSRTVTMTSAAVSLGEDVGGLRAFPRPERLLSLDDARMRSTLGCGFRARYLRSLCERAVTEPDLYLGETWARLSPVAFRAEMDGLLGFGPSSIEYVSRMYSPAASHHYDSWVLRRCEELWGVTGDGIDDFVTRRYRRFGDMGPTVMWLELTRHWHEGADS